MKVLPKSEETPSPPIHALEAARDRLAKVLSQGIKDHDRTGKCLVGDDICKAIEVFVAAIVEVPGGHEELRRRSGFVGEQCGPGTEYASIKTATLGNHAKAVAAVRGTLTGSWLWRLVLNDEHPTTPMELAEQLAAIDSLLRPGGWFATADEIFKRLVARRARFCKKHGLPQEEEGYEDLRRQYEILKRLLARRAAFCKKHGLPQEEERCEDLRRQSDMPLKAWKELWDEFRESLQSWRDLIRDIQIQGELVAMAGCYCLGPVYQARQAGSAYESRLVRNTVAAGGHLGDILEAVDSLCAWAKDNAGTVDADSDNTPASSQKGGPNDGKASANPVATKTWYHSPTESRPKQYSEGPIVGNKKGLGQVLGGAGKRPDRELERQGEAGEVYVVRIKKGNYQVWFLTHDAYARANAKDIQLKRDAAPRSRKATV